MLAFILSRLLRTLLTLFIIVTFAFFVLRLSGDPVSRFFDIATTPREVVEAFRHQWGLDQPVWVQFYKYLGAVLQGDLGNSMRENRSAVAAGNPGHHGAHAHPQDPARSGRRHCGGTAPQFDL